MNAGFDVYYAKSLKWLLLSGVLEHAYWALLDTLLFALMFLPPFILLLQSRVDFKWLTTRLAWVSSTTNNEPPLIIQVRICVAFSSLDTFKIFLVHVSLFTCWALFKLMTLRFIQHKKQCCLSNVQITLRCHILRNTWIGSPLLMFPELFAGFFIYLFF